MVDCDIWPQVKVCPAAVISENLKLLAAGQKTQHLLTAKDAKGRQGKPLEPAPIDQKSLKSTPIWDGGREIG
jgi:hypothetical protein